MSDRAPKLESVTESIPGVSLLSDELLGRIRSRAAGYDAANEFFHEDFDELVAAGYLRAFVPALFGGQGMTLAQVIAEQQRLAAAAPATALAVNMHLVWTGVAKALHERGDDSLDWLLREAGAGAVFGFGISEPGNDLMLFGSKTAAERQPDGGYRFTGTKVFTSLSPVWSTLGVMGLDTASDDGPKIVYGFVDRRQALADGSVEILDDWNTLGMRASQSNTTRLMGAYSPPERIVRRLDPGPNPDQLIFAIFANFELLLSAVYTGIAGRAIELAVDAAKTRTSFKAGGVTLDQNPLVRHLIAEAAIAYDALPLQLTSLARDVDDLVNHGARWFPLLVGAKIRSTEAARVVVEKAIRVASGSAYSATNELSRLYRDVLAGLFHPSNDESAHNTVASLWLGPLR